jgi:RNA polymerase sigma-70 factor (ECF subfamily)
MDRQERFLKLLLRSEADVRAFIGSLVRDRHLREEVFQEAALTLWQKFDAYDPGRSFAAWARGVAARKVLQQRDKLGRAAVPFSDEAIEAVRAAYDRTETTASPKADALEECVAKLPERSRRLLALRYQQSLKLADVARAVSSTADAVHKALSRLRAALEECVRRRLQVAQER